MSLDIIFGILLPFIGTTLGAAAVFVLPKNNRLSDGNALSGFAAGVMMAASVWSLIIPAVNMSSHLEFFAFFPVLLGLWAGAVFLVLCERATDLLSLVKKENSFTFFLAVVLHNIPEGMAVGVAFAAALAGTSKTALLSALMLSLGMTMQNVPEGAIISLPSKRGGRTKAKAFLIGTLSGAVEPVAAFAALIFSSAATVLLPYLLGFAAGAMIYVCAKELIPKAQGKCGVIWFFAGFSVMMVLDVALG